MAIPRPILITRGPSSGISFQDLQAHFDQPLSDVARKFNVCTTFFKKICRHFGIKRWPFRKITSLEKKIANLQNKAVFGTKPGQMLAKYHLQIKQVRTLGRVESDGDSEELENDADLNTPPPRSPSTNVVADHPHTKRNTTPTVLPVDRDFESYHNLEVEVCLRLSSMLRKNLVPNKSFSPLDLGGISRETYFSPRETYYLGDAQVAAVP
eukprot:TRINITY_DN430_c0_g1_i1.p1 TRINITY_DN430_c0_g1~~TRINITY_DN430_c0_g1_i1.p1  ORF type:complete len:210 (-),score=27.86 TRINITY_DN430_c0_g1_i1:487-1116(-)